MYPKMFFKHMFSVFRCLNREIHAALNETASFYLEPGVRQENHRQ
jgi:hypothetical protein